MSSIRKENFGTVDARPVTKFTLVNRNGVSLVCTDFGCTILEVHTPDKFGKFENITICYRTLEELQNPPSRPYFGAIIGRFCNRIENGHLEIDGKTYQLNINNGPNSLHGGSLGFDRRLWDVVKEIENEKEVGLVFQYVSKDGEENYPGNLTVQISYILSNENTLTITFQAQTDQATVVNLTNHAYWNLSGNAKNRIYDHLLHLGSSSYLPVSHTAIPTGEIRPVVGTPFDYTSMKPLAPQMLEANGGGKPGIDHCYVIDQAFDAAGNYIYDPLSSDEYLRFAAKVVDPQSGRSLTVHATQPGIQIYTSNFLSEDPANHPFLLHNGICLETQHFPDSPNKPNFPSVLLTPRNKYLHKAVYTFSNVV